MECHNEKQTGDPNHRVLGHLKFLQAENQAKKQAFNKKQQRPSRLFRNKLYRKCNAALQGGILTNDSDLDTIRKTLQEAFKSADLKLMNLHPQMRARIELLLKQNKVTKKDVKNILQVF